MRLIRNATVFAFWSPERRWRYASKWTYITNLSAHFGSGYTNLRKRPTVLHRGDPKAGGHSNSSREVFRLILIMPKTGQRRPHRYTEATAGSLRNSCPTVHPPLLRGNSKKLKSSEPWKIIATFFLHRIVTAWNKLPEEALSTLFVQHIKASMDKAWSTPFPKLTYDHLLLSVTLVVLPRNTTHFLAFPSAI